MVVRGKDWSKILPYLKDGSFNPREVPDPTVVVLNPHLRFEPGAVEENDAPLYNRIVNTLMNLFPTTFPTSNL